ncbi:hypothetical protein [Bacteriovorax sp. Seq25_V]|uniref:hypothetical protein n=1 Tax=Bacteriovorax sp. Seq25_V TaxID=1201288 RepID=UPI000389E637|nr:hypothetical protein [Bacteriovorax sp. Seq25_V]EQC45625.1 hypothetical protein M900_2258 [Bacteriovorax sp. Seq25_V]
MRTIIFALISLSIFANPGPEKLKFYQGVFLDLAKTDSKKIPDPISDNPINTELLVAKNSKNKTIGYIREITTTTGCNSECLPVIFTLFYNQDKVLVKLKSIPGLTKKYHARFTDKDYQKLDMILALNPEIFKKVGHPTEMVDAISGATKKEFENDVVKNAAYTSLRVNLYNQQTIEELKKLF